MADETFRLPDLGEGLTEAQLVSWRVQEGAAVEVNAPLCDVETAKAVVVIPSPFKGTVRTLHARPGESVPVGGPLVTIAVAPEARVDEGPSRAGRPEARAVPRAIEASAAPERTLVGYGPEAGPDTGVRRRPRVAATAGTEVTGDVRAAPFVRQLAKEKGVDLSRVTGTGPGGRITRGDIEAAAATPSGAPVGQDGDRRISVVGIRKAIARQMVRSVSTIPQFTEFALFDATNLVAARERAKASGKALTPLPYFIAALVRAVREHPLLNSSWDETADEILIKGAINVGIAVNTKNGLLVPVLRGAEQLDLGGIAERAAGLIEGARAGTLTPAQMTGGTITVTNVGASGPVETGTPIVNPPECCVVGFGAIRLRPLVVDGEVVARDSAWISITVDHRIVDGALATEFLTRLVRELETIGA